MSFIDKLRGELIDIIEWVDDSRHTLVWRFPRYHNQIKHGARLIVRPGQQAVFVHQGRIADVFDPGTYTLDTGNLAILSTLQGWMHGFDSPFKAEVYFVTTRQITDLKWGTPNPVIVRDPDFGPIRVRAFGAYTLKAQDARALLKELVGTDQQFDAEEISALLRSIMSTAFAELVANSGISILDLASNYNELSESLRQAVVERIDDEYGLDIPQLMIVNISVPEEVEKALDARSSMGVIGDLAMYQHYQLGHSMPIAAANPAGGLAGAGVGVGMGMAVAGQMLPGPGGGPASGPAGGGQIAQQPTQHLAQQPGQQPAAVGVLAALTDAPSHWHIIEDGQTIGPLTTPQLIVAVVKGRIQPETLVWNERMTSWMLAGQLPQLQTLFDSPTPPPPPRPAES